MKVKNKIILAIANLSGRNITANTISAEYAYNVILFRRAIRKAFGELQEKEKELVRECKLEVGEKGRVTGDDRNVKRFVAMRQKLYEDEVEMEGINTIPFAAWHDLKKENKAFQDAFIEDSLEGVLWDAPTK